MLRKRAVESRTIKSEAVSSLAAQESESVPWGFPVHTRRGYAQDVRRRLKIQCASRIRDEEIRTRAALSSETRTSRDGANDRNKEDAETRFHKEMMKIASSLIK